MRQTRVPTGIGVILAVVLGIPALSADLSSDDPSTSPGAVRSDAPRAAPVEFTGTLTFGICHEATSPGGSCDMPIIDPAILVPFTDPRLNGNVSILGMTLDGLELPADLWVGSFRIGNQGGHWQEMALPRLQHHDGTPTQLTSAFVGQGGYDGLIAISEVTVTGPVFAYHGWIVEGGIAGVPDWSEATVAETPQPDQ